MRIKNWDYRELRERIADGLTLRQFTDFYCAPVPKHDAFQRGVVRLQPQTLVTVNDLLIRVAVKLGLEDGTKLRVDTTVVQTDIHHPTDSTLLLGRSPRCYTLGQSPGHSAGTAENRGFLQSDAVGPSQDV